MKEDTNLNAVRKKAVEKALQETKGNRTHAADILGISVRSVRNYIKEYDLSKKFPSSKGRQK